MKGGRPTAKWFEVLELLFQARALTDRMIQTAIFTEGNASGCQRILTLMHRNRWVSRIDSPTHNQPAIYLLDRYSTTGNRFMRSLHGDDQFREKTYKLGSVEHLLGINEVLVRIIRATKDLGWDLKLWLNFTQLSSALPKSFGLVPDAYFQLQRVVDGEIKTSGFFLEFERTIKAQRVLTNKLTRYERFYRTGLYTDTFSMRAMRVLVVFSNEYRISDQSRVEGARKLAQKLGMTRACFAAFETIRSVHPKDVLTSPLWYKSDTQDPTPLFQ